MSVDETREAHDERWHDDLAAYSLDSLGEREAAIFETHLAECESCRERLRWLTPAVDQIPSDVEQFSAPPALRASLMEIVDAEAAVPRATTSAVPAAKEKRSWLPSFASFTMRPALAGFAVVLLLIAGVVGYELHETDTGGGGDSQTYTAQAADGLASTGTLEVDGDSGTITVADMSPPKSGVYQAWIMDAEGSVSPSAVFVTSRDGSGSVSIPDGLEGAQKVMITQEPKGGSESPTSTVLMTANIA